MAGSDAALTDRERIFLLALNELGVPFLVVGMSAALLQGARGATEDIDVGKRAANRVKDRAVLPALELALALIDEKE
jgi:hypothetical protein